jgi:hypothetical protein
MAAEKVARKQAVQVSDPLQAAADASLPTVQPAIDPDVAEAQLNEGCRELVAARGPIQVVAIRVTRRKPGRRCVIEYDVQFPQARDADAAGIRTLIGKVRAKGVDRKTPVVLAELRRAGFGADSADQISVPAPLGVLPDLAMWLQEKVPGIPAARLLREANGIALAQRIAEATYKLHQAKVRPPQQHTMADELRILHERVPRVVATHPRWEQRLQRLLAACDRLGAAVAHCQPCPIHRDFYGAHVLVDASRLWLLDFDLFCEGDPALDAGNFIGHITEESLRQLGDPAALSEREQALEERFVELHGPPTRAAVRAYTALTLVRHIYISTLFPDRAGHTEQLLEMCEARLAGG